MRCWLVLASLLVACGGAQKPDALRAPGAGILRHVPAETPYLVAVLAPPPAAYLEKARLAAAGLKPRLEPLLALLGGSEDPGLRFLGELLRQADLEALASSGAVQQLVVYGRGLYPVLRVRLKDAAPLRAEIARAAAASKVTLVPLDGGMASVSAGSVGDVVFGVREAEQELAIGLAPPGEARQLAAHLAGRAPPEKVYDPGELDLRGPARHGFGAVDSTRLLEAIADRVPMLGGAPCRRELASLATIVPRLAMTTDEVTDSGLRGRIVISLRSDVALRLAALRVGAPGVGIPVGDGIASLGFALDLARGVTLLSDAASGFAAQHHQCLPLMALDRAALELAQSLAAGPAVLGAYREVLGFAVVLRAIEPGDAVGYMLLTASDPFQLFDMAKQLIPGLANIQLRADGTPVVIPAGTTLLPTDAYVAVRGQTLGIGIGSGTDKALAAALAAPLAEGRPVMSMAADMAKLEKLFKTLGAFLGDGAGSMFSSPSMYRSFDMRLFFEERGIVMSFRTDL